MEIRNFKLSKGTCLLLGKKLVELLASGDEYCVNVTKWSKRSREANAVQHVWYKAISEHTGEDIKTVECRCKRDFGLPILFASDKGVVQSWLLKDLHRLSDEQQLKVIAVTAVTRDFTSSEHKQYRDNIQSFWNQNGLFLDYV